MRKIVLSMMVSIDGYIEASGKDINWHVWDGEMSDCMIGFFDTVDTFLYGRVSYELMTSYWPTQSGKFADIMNNTPKIVFSRSLKNTTWNSEVIHEGIAEKMNHLKKQKGKDLVLFAGADIATEFIKNNLIDQYRLIVNPIVLGNGTPLFKNVKNRLSLSLIETQSFKCGNILHVYEPVN